jgi:multicomponent Na+:H+ antiporter subunit E
MKPSLLPEVRSAAAARLIGFFLIWLMLMPSARPADLIFGAATALAATALSLRLYVPLAGRLHLVAFIGLLPHFVWQSILGGIDVAWRTLAPQMRLNPGFVACPLDLPEGLARNTFATVTSLMPGTLPCGEEKGVLIYHCLDIGQPVVEQLWAEEALMARAMTAGRKHG